MQKNALNPSSNTPYKNHNRKQKLSRCSHQNYKIKVSAKLHERKNRPLDTEMCMFSKIAWYGPQAAYSCFIIRFKQKPTYFMGTKTSG